MSQYIVKSGNLYADGNRGWVTDQNQAYIWCDLPDDENERSRAEYKPNLGLIQAKSHADTFRAKATKEEVEMMRIFGGATEEDIRRMTIGNTGHEDARAVRLGSYVEVEL